MSISHFDNIQQLCKMLPLGKVGGRVQGILCSISASPCESIINILYYFKIKHFKNIWWLPASYMAGLSGELKP